MMHNLIRSACLAVAVLPVVLPGPLAAQTPPPQEPAIAAASDEAQRAMQVFLIPEGVTAEVFAAEPDVANPVAIDIDARGRVFVCESFRQERGIEDNRNHPEWLEEDLAAQTVADRLAYIRRHLGEAAVEYTRQDDRIRLLEDTDGDGRADRSTVFADRFNAIEEGTGAGALFVDGVLYYTCIPRLWKLEDQDGDRVADKRTALHDGFGVRFAFRGHDLHGLIIGPDGRLYFSIGDRGYHVNEQISDPSSGAVFRCELDGSNLEVVATGLRNPQELAFDDNGNLFTGDNNSDSGDRARMVYVVEGGDSGWRMEYQYLPDRGPFNRERIWHPYDPDSTPAYIVPPINNFADGPSGFACYPGTGFSDHLQGRFLLCDFRGQTTGSGVKTFRLNPKGAFFEIVDEENTFWNILATDCCFGPDGRLYISDWVHGWDGLGKGRVYAFSDSGADQAAIRQVQELLAGDWSALREGRLLQLLNHADRRVRMQAQFELVRRGSAASLETAARFTTWRVGRLHGLWGLDQLVRANPADPALHESFAVLLGESLSDVDPEVQAHASRLSGELLERAPDDATWRSTLASRLLPLLASEYPRVQYFATMAAGKAGIPSAVNEIADMLAANADRDPMLRHAGIMALSQLGKSLDYVAAHEQPAVRLATVVALRKRAQRGQIHTDLLKKLLLDSQPRVVLEAARAIHDLPIPELMPDLAKLAGDSAMTDPLARRVINANFRLGEADSLARLQSFIHDSTQIHERRLDAIEMLGQWDAPPTLDHVLGMWRPLPTEARADASLIVRGLIGNDSHLDQRLASAALRLAGNMRLPEVEPRLREMIQSAQGDDQVWALTTLLEFSTPDRDDIIQLALASEQSALRMAACRYLARQSDDAVLPWLEKAANSDDRAERQNALSILGEMSDEPSATMLARLLGQFDQIPPDSRLDLWLAVEQREDDRLRQMRDEFREQRESADPQFTFRMTLEGGNAEAGSGIFHNRLDVSCLRCHKIQGSGGDVGPNLSEIGKQRERALLLESLIEPNKTITENFETVVVVDIDGNTHIGVPKTSTGETLSIITADAIMVHIPQADIEEMRRGQSAMPDDVTEKLSLSEIRDLIEFLSSQTTPDRTVEQQVSQDE